MDDLSRLVEVVSSSAKYRHVDPVLIGQIGERVLSQERNMKAAVKATKSKLHQVGAAYFSPKINYERALAELESAVNDETAYRQTCLKLMGLHASTRERLPFLDEFYPTIFADLPPIHSVIDLACGLNPLSIGWMPLAEDVTYYACDIYADLTDFLVQFMELEGVIGRAEARDITISPPTHRADLALILKTIPCIEQIDKTAGRRLLEEIDARFLLVSFPTRSLGGKNKGMSETYEAHFNDLIAGSGWDTKRYQFASELVFLVEKS